MDSPEAPSPSLRLTQYTLSVWLAFHPSHCCLIVVLCSPSFQTSSQGTKKEKKTRQTNFHQPAVRQQQRQQKTVRRKSCRQMKSDFVLMVFMRDFVLNKSLVRQNNFSLFIAIVYSFFLFVYKTHRDEMTAITKK